MKNKTFLKSLAVFLVLIIGVMFLQLPSLHRPAQKAGAARTVPLLPPDALKRFRKTVDFSGAEAAGADWTVGRVGEMPAWRDNRTGLVWSARLPGISFMTLLKADLEQAAAACADLAPKGAWLLPAVEEFDFASRDLSVLDRDGAKRWISYAIAGDRTVPMGRNWGSAKEERIFHVRCVARVKV